MGEVLAIDVGTTAVKAAVVDQRLAVRRSATAPLDTKRRGPRIEQDPGQWWQATRAVVADLQRHRTLDGSGIEAITVTGQMQDLVPVRAGRHVGPALLYSDHRAGVEHGQLVAELGEQHWFRLTRNLQDPGNVAAKWRWLYDHEPDRARRADHVLLGAHSYIAYRATGIAACDPTTATTTGLFDALESRWADEVAAAARLDVELLPRLQDPGTPLGPLTPQAAAELDLRAGTPVFHSAGDAGTSTIGVGAGTGGRYVYLGTSGWLAASVPADVSPRPELFTLAHPVPGHAIQVGPMISVGACVDWALATIADSDDHSLLEAAAGQVPGPSGLLFLPYLAGERSPFHDPAARGAFIGLALDTGRAHLLKAVLEGVALSLAAIGDLIDPPRPDGQPLRLCGGGSRSPSWCQIFADIFGEPVVRIASMEHVGLIGAARLTAPSLGWQPPAEPDGDEELALRPDTADPAAYRELRALHQRAYPQLREIVHQLPRPTGAPEPELKHSNRKEPST